MKAHSNISDVVKILVFAAAVIITCIIVWLGFRAAEAAKKIGGSAINQMSELNNDIEDSDIMKFDGAVVYGSDVVNFIKKQLGDYTIAETAPIYITVSTSLSVNTYTNGSSLSDIRNFSHPMYIKPTALFTGAVIKNSNDVIMGVSFLQE